MNVALLKQQHLAIMDAGRKLDELCAGSLEDALPHLGAARSGLAQLIARHHVTEEAELHAPLRNRKLAGQIACYGDIAAQTRELRLAYSAHIAAWPMAAITADWNGYRNSARELALELQALALREERDLFPAAQALLSRAA
jgi:hypothetical protein